MLSRVLGLSHIWAKIQLFRSLLSHTCFSTYLHTLNPFSCCHSVILQYFELTHACANSTTGWEHHLVDRCIWGSKLCRWWHFSHRWRRKQLLSHFHSRPKWIHQSDDNRWLRQAIHCNSHLSEHSLPELGPIAGEILQTWMIFLCSLCKSYLMGVFSFEIPGGLHDNRQSGVAWHKLPVRRSHTSDWRRRIRLQRHYRGEWKWITDGCSDLKSWERLLDRSGHRFAFLQRHKCEHGKSYI